MTGNRVHHITYHVVDHIAAHHLTGIAAAHHWEQPPFSMCVCVLSSWRKSVYWIYVVLKKEPCKQSSLVLFQTLVYEGILESQTKELCKIFQKECMHKLQHGKCVVHAQQLVGAFHVCSNSQPRATGAGENKAVCSVGAQ
jgi:hypothetical protein